MRSLLKANFSDCTALQAKLGERFRALSAEEQRWHAEHRIARAEENRPRRLLRLSIITDRRSPARHREALAAQD